MQKRVLFFLFNLLLSVSAFAINTSGPVLTTTPVMPTKAGDGDQIIEKIVTTPTSGMTKTIYRTKDDKATSSKKGSSFSCTDKFFAHSDAIAMFESDKNICGNYRANKSYIGNVLWKNFFACYDKFNSASHGFAIELYYRQCLSADDNTWLLSKNFNKCSKKIMAYVGMNLIDVCDNRRNGEGVLTRTFDTCTATLDGTNISKQRRVEICSDFTGQKTVSCYGKLSTLVDSKVAYSRCSNNLETRRSVNDTFRTFNQCFNDLADTDLIEDRKLNICSKWNGADQAKCIVNTKDRFGLDHVYFKCQELEFREINQNKNFTKCITKVEEDGIDSEMALEICTTTSEQLKTIVESKSFDQCLAQGDKLGIKKLYMYSTCSDYEIGPKMKTSFYSQCLKRGIKAGSFEYFDMKAKELKKMSTHSRYRYSPRYATKPELKNPYEYVFKDCLGDYKYKDEKKKYNRALKVYQDLYIHSNKLFQDKVLIGGLSSVRVNEGENKLYILSDDRGYNAKASPRMYVYDYDFDGEGKLSLEEDSILYLIKEGSYTKFTPTTEESEEIAELANADGQVVKKKMKKMKKEVVKYQIDMDPEGFDFTEDGNIIVSSEVDDLSSNDFLSVFNPEGNAIDTIAINDAFKPMTHRKKICYDHYDSGREYGRRGDYAYDGGGDHNGVKKKRGQSCHTRHTRMGVVPNKSFESLSMSPDKNYLFTANEDALEQDKSRSYSSKRGERVRLVRYAKVNGKFEEEAQFFYRLEKEPENGLVDVLALDGDNLLTLERSWDNIAQKITARIYIVNLVGAENILETHPDDIKAVRSVKKKLVLDLDKIKYELAPGFRKFDNFEGMTLGPELPNGKKSLILVTDNNFRLNQLTTVLILELDIRELHNLIK